MVQSPAPQAEDLPEPERPDQPEQPSVKDALAEQEIEPLQDQSQPASKFSFSPQKVFREDTKEFKERDEWHQESSASSDISPPSPSDYAVVGSGELWLPLYLATISSPPVSSILSSGRDACGEQLSEADFNILQQLARHIPRVLQVARVLDGEFDDSRVQNQLETFVELWDEHGFITDAGYFAKGLFDAFCSAEFGQLESTAIFSICEIVASADIPQGSAVTDLAVFLCDEFAFAARNFFEGGLSFAPQFPTQKCAQEPTLQKPVVLLFASSRTIRHCFLPPRGCFFCGVFLDFTRRGGGVRESGHFCGGGERSWRGSRA